MSVTLGQNRVLSGYGLKLRSLRQQDLDSFEQAGIEIEWDRSTPERCIVVEAEDMACAVAAIVDMDNGDIVWSSVPQGDGPDPKWVSLDREDMVGHYLRDVLHAFLPDSGL